MGSLTDVAFRKLGHLAGVQFRKARWVWQSVAGTEDDGIRAEQSVGRDMAEVVLQDMGRDPDEGTRILLDDAQRRLAEVVRNQVHRFHTTAVAVGQPTAFALPGGFIFVARALVDVCERDRDELAFVVAHEMSHVIRRHAMDRMLQQGLISAVSMASPGRGVFAPWIRRVGIQGLERAYSQDQEFEADELGVRLMRAARFDTAGAVRCLDRLAALSQRADPLGLGTYLSTHPPLDERVRRLRGLGLVS